MGKIWDAPPMKTPKRLFYARKQHKRGFWQFIHLVPCAEAENLPEDQLKNEHAMYAWCTKCKCPIPFSKGKHQVGNHMRLYHGEELQDFEAFEREQMMNKGRMENTAAILRTLPESKEQMQAKFTRKISRWVASSYRPISIVEDSGFRDIINERFSS